MEHQLNGKYGRISLEPLRENELERLRKLRNRWAKEGVFLSSELITPEAQRKWFQHYQSRPDDYMFSVYSCDTHVLIGAVSLYHIDIVQSQAEFGRLMIDKDILPQSHFGYDVTVAACQLGFNEIGLHRIYLSVYEDNTAAIRVYRKVGFNEYKVDINGGGGGDFLSGWKS